MGFRLLSCHRAPFDPFPIFLLVIINIIFVILIIYIVSIIIVIIVNIIATKFNLLYQIRIGVTIFESIHNFQKLHMWLTGSDWQLKCLGKHKNPL